MDQCEQKNCKQAMSEIFIHVMGYNEWHVLKKRQQYNHPKKTSKSHSNVTHKFILSRNKSLNVISQKSDGKEQCVRVLRK